MSRLAVNGRVHGCRARLSCTAAGDGGHRSHVTGVGPDLFRSRLVCRRHLSDPQRGRHLLRPAPAAHLEQGGGAIRLAHDHEGPRLPGRQRSLCHAPGGKVVRNTASSGGNAREKSVRQGSLNRDYRHLQRRGGGDPGDDGTPVRPSSGSKVARRSARVKALRSAPTLLAQGLPGPDRNLDAGPRDP